MLAQFGKTFAGDGYRLRPLLRAIAMDPSFSVVSMPTPAPEKSAAVSQSTKVASNN
jgi:hypothetical protein